MIKKSVFVTDGYWRKTLAVVRALRQSAIKVSVGERTPLATALFSRYADKRCIYPSATLQPDAFISWLKHKVAGGDYDVLITPEEETALLISKHRDIFSPFVRIPLVGHETLCLARDKSQLLSHAGSIGIAFPKSITVTSLEENLHHQIANLGYPLVLKPIIGSGGRGIRYCHDARTAISQASALFRHYGPFLIQEYIPGNEIYGVSTIFNAEHKMRSAFVHRKLRQYPATGGVSTYAISVRHPNLVLLTEKLLTSLRWYGVANLEFKVDARDGIPKLMEVNPRFWGSLQLAVSSGVNFPYMLYRLAVEGDVEPVFDYRTGFKFRWFIPGDLMHFFTSIGRRKIDPAFFKVYERNTCCAVGSWSDPLPLAGEALSLIDFFISPEMKVFHGKRDFD